MAGLLAPDSSFYKALSAATDLVLVNLATLAGCIPIVTAGASLTACARVTMEMAREEDSYIMRTWWRSFRSNLIQSFGWWIPTLVIVILAWLENWLLGGISSGAAAHAALKVAAELGAGHTVAAVLCDTGERYLSHPVYSEA